jgi:hypothetical protein
MGAEADIPRVRRQPGELGLTHVDQRRVIAALKIYIGPLMATRVCCFVLAINNA